MTQVYHTLKQYFGYDSFRDGQEPIVNAILSGEDSLAIMPTGAGKSICYQLPALLLPGITLVISPLISLMQDQVKALNQAGVMAAYVNSSLSESQISKVLMFASQGKYKIIYVAPERLKNYSFLQFAHNAEISMVTVDEAHCISQWGQDFRPSYLEIVTFVNHLALRPILSAFTATATHEVKDDILCTLGLQHPTVIVTGFDRANLYFQVEHNVNKDAFVLDYAQTHEDESGIIYCATRKNVEKLHEKLIKKGLSVGKYHAGMDNEERKKSQDDFIYDRTPIMIATNAFGMGIDKSNVRYVIHYNMTQSMENYYQEAGRAGRDGEDSKCILLYSPQDVMIIKFLLEQKDFTDVELEDVELIQERDQQRLQTMVNYCKTSSCLRTYILHYFGEQTKGSCDSCGNCHRTYETVDMTSEAKWVLNCLYETRGRYGLSILLGTLMGANRARLRELGTHQYKSYGALKELSEAEVRNLVDYLVVEEYIYQTTDRYSVMKLGKRAHELQEESAQILLRKYEEKVKSQKTQVTKKTDELTGKGYQLFDQLRELRLVIAREEAVPPYIVFNDKTLIHMCVKQPKTKAEMLQVSGVGDFKYEKYGERFLTAILQFSK